MNKNLEREILKLEKKIKNPSKGLSDEVFLFLTRLTPMINVDLLIKDKKKGTLLSWRRPGEKYSAGWHIPGGIIRFRDSIKNRIKNVSKYELKSSLKNIKFLGVFEIKLKQKNRSHFISLLYSGELASKVKKKMFFKKGIKKEGDLKWFKKAPKNLIFPHKIYKKFVN